MDRLFMLQEVFRQVFDNDGLVVTPDTSHRDIAGWDSITHVKLVLALEEEFGIQFTEDEISSLHTVGDFLKVVELQKEHDV